MDWDGTASTLTALEICPLCARLLLSPQRCAPSIFKNVPHRTQHSWAEAAFKDGRKIKSITFIIDENPMPVVAAFRFGDNRERASLGLDIRLDHASPVCVVVEAK